MTDALPAPLRDRLTTGRTDFHRTDADARGLSPHLLTRWVRAGHLEALGGGDYVITADLEGAAFHRERALHLRRAASILTGLPGAYLVGRSAAIAHGLPVLHMPETVEISRSPRPKSRRASVTTRYPWGSPPTLVKGLDVQPWAETVCEIAAGHGPCAGLVAADAALHRGLPRAELEAAAVVFGSRRGAADVRLVARLANGRIESPGESQTRWWCYVDGIELEPQVVVQDEHGGFVALVDFQVKDSAVLLEFDGMLKYRSDRDLAREKHRQLDIERLGYVVIRVVSDDLRRPHILTQRIREAVALSSARSQERLCTDRSGRPFLA